VLLQIYYSALITEVSKPKSYATPPFRALFGAQSHAAFLACTVEWLAVWCICRRRRITSLAND